MHKNGTPPDTHPKATEALIMLLDIMRRLRQPNGCPWDRKQTSMTLRPYLLEETYEVLEAIEANDPDWLCEELGDLLLQVVFHAQIHAEAGHFAMSDVIAGIADKLTRRHPHVFADQDYESEEQLRESWARIKQEEKGGQKPHRKNNEIPPQLPALQKAQKLLGRYADKNPIVDFDSTLSSDLKFQLEKLMQLENQLFESALAETLLTLAGLANVKGVDSESILRNFLRRLV